LAAKSNLLGQIQGRDVVFLLLCHRKLLMLCLS